MPGRGCNRTRARLLGSHLDGARLPRGLEGFRHPERQLQRLGAVEPRIALRVVALGEIGLG